MGERRELSFAASSTARDENVRRAQGVVGVVLARVRYFEIDSIGESFGIPRWPGPAHRPIEDPREWEQAIWRHPTCDSLDWGLELESTTGRVFSMTWDRPRGGSIGIEEQPLGRDALGAVWDVTDRSRWQKYVGRAVTGITMHYVRGDPFDVVGSGQDDWSCWRITITFGRPSVDIVLGEARNDHVLFPNYDNVAVLFDQRRLLRVWSRERFSR